MKAVVITFSNISMCILPKIYTNIYLRIQDIL